MGELNASISGQPCKLTQQAGFWTHASVSLVASVTCSMQHCNCVWANYITGTAAAALRVGG